VFEVKNLMVFYENALAINDLSLEVKEGEIVGLFGSNSAGKSTLFNTTAGLTHHMAVREARRGGQRITIYGEIQFNGENIVGRKPNYIVKKGIVLCRERHPVFRDLTTRQNLELGGFLLDQKKIKEGIELAYEIFPNLKELKDRKAGLLSGGEQEMVSIGIALVAQPKLMLLDEPLLGLSPLLQQKVVQALQDIRESGVTVFVSEQYARPVMPFVDRGYIIENGTLVFSGTKNELMENPEVMSAYFGT